MQMTVGVEATQVASGELARRHERPGGLDRRLADVAEECARSDANFTVDDTHADVVEGASDIVAVVTGAVDADHRATLGQSIALVSGQAERPRLAQQSRGDAGAADGEVAQCRWRALPSRRQEQAPRLEQFGHEDQAVRTRRVDFAL